MKRGGDGNPKLQDKYLTQYTHLMRLVGITLAERVIQVICHFLSAPPLLLQDEGIGLCHRTVLMNVVRLKYRLTSCTSHEIAIKIAKKQSVIPSYCLTYEGQCCVQCTSKLEM